MTGRRSTPAAAAELAPSPFDLEGHLPTGTSLLEASAGTGKTYTIARLVSRYLGEGVARMDQLLVVSFSEASSRELRDRVRERLVADRDSATGVTRDRLERALGDFDGATVTTTHGFCNALLRELGTAADHDRDAVLIEDPSDVVDEVIADLYVRRWGHSGSEPPPLDAKQFRELVRLAALQPATPLVPRPEEVDGAVRLSAQVAVDARAETARRLRAARLLTYDDMVLRLDAALQDPDTAEVAAARMRRRFSVVLVDEFQDTDPVQWRILRTAFHGHATLVLVGDPKQAIYGFRGADVHAYLDARRDAGITATLPENHRSDPEVLRGLAALFQGAALGDPQIVVQPVRAALGGRRLDGGAPVRLRVLQRDEGRTVNRQGISVSDARAAIRDDVAGQVVALLGGASLTEADGSCRPVRPGDIAVIVRRNDDAEATSERLHAAGVPAIVSGRASVFATPAAEAWQHLLEALEQPHRTGRVRRLAVGPLVGRTAETLEDRIDDLALDVRVWLRVLEERGVAALAERVQADLRLPERLLRQTGGERLLTDLRHIGEVLHAEALRSGLGLTALASWLHRRRAEEDDQSVERSRRLETDAAAVQVLTSHAAKGLEFPVVLAPSLWDHYSRKDHPYPRFHDATGRRVRDIGGRTGPDHAEHVTRCRHEDADEELRLAYVTLTRAAALVIAWWAPTANSSSAPLTRLLLHDAPGAVAPHAINVPNDADALTRFRARAAASEGALEVSVVPATEAAGVGQWVPPPHAAPNLRLAMFERGLDLQWGRTSYSALTHLAHEATYGAGLVPGPTDQSAFASEPGTAQKDDESDVVAAAAEPRRSDPDADLLRVPSAWEDLPGGTLFGTLVHRILERYEPGTDLPALVATTSRGRGADIAALSAAIGTALRTPLGPMVGGRTWAHIGSADRLAELEFELPLAGGDAPGAASAALTGLADLWREHVPDGRLSGYADLLERLAAAGPSAGLRGYLTGSIDAVVRVQPATTGTVERYLVVDHKTNRLAPREEALTAWHYRGAALERAMLDAHYPLQALLYSVALHRYLRWRRRGYDPEQHLGGVLYLFLRGMSGPGVLDSTGAVPGVFAWRPPSGLVVALSNLLAGDAS